MAIVARRSARFAMLIASLKPKIDRDTPPLSCTIVEYVNHKIFLFFKAIYPISSGFGENSGYRGTVKGIVE